MFFCSQNPRHPQKKTAFPYEHNDNGHQYHKLTLPKLQAPVTVSTQLETFTRRVPTEA
jgi:hypothetical protein